jgi:hypothetical protein
MRAWLLVLPPVCGAALALAACGDGGGGEGGSASDGAGSSAASGQGGEPAAGGGGGAASTTSASASTGPSTTASSTGSGVAPIACGPTYATFTAGACDLLQQDCPPGQHCNWKSAGGGEWTTACEDRGGLKNLGADCGVNEECEAGLFCIFGVCTPVCCPTNDEPCAGGNCNLDLSLDGDDGVRLCTYSKQCIPLTAEACPEDTGCHFEEPQVATCVPGSGNDVPEGGACEALNDCGDMQQCSSQQDACRYICLLAENSQPPGFGGCLAGQACRTAPEVGLDGLGLCFPE